MKYGNSVSYKRKGQVFTIDFLATVLIVTVLLGFYLQNIEFSEKKTKEPTLVSPALLSQGLLGYRSEIALEKSRFRQDRAACPPGSFAYCYNLGPHIADAQMALDALNHPKASLSVLVEEGVPLGPAHASLQEIQQKGGGRYSDRVEGATFYLVMSSKDNTSPSTNTLNYTLVTFDQPPFNAPVFCVVQLTNDRVLTDGCTSYDWNACGVQTTTRFYNCGKTTCVMRVYACEGNAKFKTS